MLLRKFTVNIPEINCGSVTGGAGPGGGGGGGGPCGGGGGGPDVDRGGKGDGGGPGGGISNSDIVPVGDRTVFLCRRTEVYFAGRMHFIYLFPGFLNIIHITD